MTKENKLHKSTNELLNPTQVGEILGLSARHILNLPLPQIRLSKRTIRYRIEDIQDYIESKGDSDE